MTKQNLPKVHVISGPNLNMLGKREPFRHKSMIADIAMGQLTGFGHFGYHMVLRSIHHQLTTH